MNKLFPDSETVTHFRPSQITQSQLDEFWISKANEIIKNEWSDSDVDDIISDLMDLSLTDNGYEMAKDLEGYSAHASYDIDVEFCEWLDNLNYHYNNIIIKNQKIWVAAHNIKPTHIIGTRLLCTETLNGCFKKDDIVYVNGIIEDVAKYIIHQDSTRSGGYCIIYEKIHQMCVVHK